MFCIRNKRTGLFSRGGVRPRWVKRGKTWNTIGSLKLHLNAFEGDRARLYADAEVVEYEFVEVRTFSVADVLNEVQAKRTEKKAERLKRAQEYTEQRERAELERLQAKYNEK